MNSYLIRILSVTSLLLLLSGCMGGAPKPAALDKSLPTVSINGHLSDMTSVAFEWKPITDPRVKGVFVYRNDPDAEDPKKLTNIGAVTNAKATHYLDSGLQPETLYIYRFATYDANANSSLATKAQRVLTKPRFAPVSFFTAAEPMARTAKLIWRPHTNHSVVAYVVERREGKNKEWKKVATVEGRLNAEYIDTELKDNTRYEYRLKAITFDDILSRATKSVVVTTQALPKPIEALTASQGKAGQITLTWRDAHQSDVLYYRVYRATRKNGTYTLVADKIKKLQYIDKKLEPAQKYYYKVVAVTPSHLEGSLKEVQSTLGTTMDAPRAPTNLVAMIENATVQLTWNSNDPRIVSYIMTKKTDTSLISSETKQFKNIKKELMIDSSLKPGEHYTFSVQGVDKNGIVSAPSNEVSFKL